MDQLDLSPSPFMHNMENIRKFSYILLQVAPYPGPRLLSCCPPDNKIMQFFVGSKIHTLFMNFISSGGGVDLIYFHSIRVTYMTL